MSEPQENETRPNDDQGHTLDFRSSPRRFRQYLLTENGDASVGDA